MPTQNGPMAHGVNAELSIRHRFEPSIRGVVFDPLPIAPEPIAMVQLRRMTIGQRRALIKLTGGQLTQTV